MLYPEEVMNLSATAVLNLPPLTDKLPKGTLFRKLPLSKAVQIKGAKRLAVFTVLWVNTFGVPFNTTGFVVVAFTRSGHRVATASFDSFGVAQFIGIPTRTVIPLVIRTFNRNGVLFRTRNVPAHVEAFSIIG